MQNKKTPKIKPIKINIPKQSKRPSINKPAIKSKTKKNIFFKMFGWLNNKLTFMFIPFSNKKGFSIRFRLYALITAVVLLIGTVTISVYLLTSRTVLIKKIGDATEEYDNRVKYLREYKLSLNNLLERVNYNKTVTNIFEKANVVKRNTDIFSDQLDIDDIEYISKISNIIKDIDISEKYIIEIMTAMDQKKSTYLKVPNILPIKNNLIISMTPYEVQNANGIYIEALPSTPIRATANANIQSIEYSKENGYEIVLEHSFNVISTYKGIGTLAIDIDGKKVEKNQTIGYLQGNIFSKSYLDYKVKFGDSYISPLFITVN